MKHIQSFNFDSSSHNALKNVHIQRQQRLSNEHCVTTSLTKTSINKQVYPKLRLVK